MTPEEYVRRVKASKQHSCVYHFTDRKNLSSIRKHGLYSAQALKRYKIDAVRGGNDWSIEADAACGMDAYVHLCFLESHPMAYQAKKSGHMDPVFIGIHPEVVLLPGIMVTNEVSNQAGVIPVPPREILGELDLQVIYDRTDWKDSAIKDKACRRAPVRDPCS